jgi:hypothetical protein
MMPSDSPTRIRTVKEHSRVVASLLRRQNIHYEVLNDASGIFRVANRVCKVGNPWYPRFKIKVNLSWFGKTPSQEKPSYPRLQGGDSIDYYLFAQDDVLLRLHYDDLWKFARLLENHRDRYQVWDKNWGMVIVPEISGYVFHWVGNRNRFPLWEVRSRKDLA